MTEFTTAPDGVRIAYDDVGEGRAVVLIHGFGASRAQNWVAPGWYDTLNGADYRVIALDCRGHGESGKPHEVAAYSEEKMVGDVAAVMKAARVGHVFIMGYSMGGYMTVRFLHSHASFARRAVVAGVGDAYFKRSNEWRVMIADAIVAPPDTDFKTAEEEMFRAFANQPGKDAQALSACMRCPRDVLSREELAVLKTPAIVVCGGEDKVSGAPGPLAEALGNARAVTVPGRDHMLTVGDKLYKKAVLEFFSEQV